MKLFIFHATLGQGLPMWIPDFRDSTLGEGLPMWIPDFRDSTNGNSETVSTMF